MPSIAIACGTVLILIGILGYINGALTERASITALIPAFFGLALAVLGIAARMKEDLRRHLMHAAVALALLGFILPAGRLVMNLGSIRYSAAVVSQVSMALVCLLFVVLGIRSFIEARRKSGAQ
jgi:hypothetical protein